MDVFVLRPPFGRVPAETDRPVCRIEYDGYYCYLSPFLPSSSSTGRRIQDAMNVGDVHFEGANLDQLQACLERALASLDTQPTRWQECTGIVSSKANAAPRKKYDTVDRERLRAQIRTLLLATREARASGGRLFFYGE